MSFTEDLALVMTLLLGVLMIGYGVLLGAVVLWIGRREQDVTVSSMGRPSAEYVLRKAA
jgi:uncharacterized Tic20 family protein